MSSKREKILRVIAMGFPLNLVLLGLLAFGIVALLSKAKDGADLVFALAALAVTCAVTVTFRRWFDWLRLPVGLAKSLVTIFGLTALFCLARYGWSTAFDGNRVTWSAVDGYSNIVLVVVAFSHMALVWVMSALLEEDDDRLSPKRMRINRVCMIVFWLIVSVRLLAKMFAYDIAAAVLCTAAAAILGVWVLAGPRLKRRRATWGLLQRPEPLPLPYLSLVVASCLVIAARLGWWLVAEGGGPFRPDRIASLALLVVCAVLPAWVAFTLIDLGRRGAKTHSQEEDTKSSLARSG